MFEEETSITENCAFLCQKLFSIRAYATFYFSSFVTYIFFVFTMWFYFIASIQLEKKNQLLLTVACVVLKMRLLAFTLRKTLKNEVLARPIIIVNQGT